MMQGSWLTFGHMTTGPQSAGVRHYDEHCNRRHARWDNENEIYTAIIPYAGRSTAKKANKKVKDKEVPRRTFVPVRRVLQSIQISTNTDCIVTRLGRRGRAEGADAVMHGTVWYRARW